MCLALLRHITAGKTREVTTIYEVVEDKDGAVYAVPDYQFTYGDTAKYKGPKSASCIPKSGSIPDSNVFVPWASTYKFAPGECAGKDEKQHFKTHTHAWYL